MKRRILIDPHNKYLIIEVACSRYIHTCIYIPQQPSQNSEGVMGGCGGGESLDWNSEGIHGGFQV